ncbi:MAG: sugar phosphate isomerase/epimerase [Sulfurimonas sp.]|uniref:sugar phosphate isomerase/epimerase family protein n=1 Tax=Sulfurimonas sp. TaxID=2022749 RepID=UPI0026115C99|nr:sugar phosphate isomerase/epimerase [Sulfurimonas sp.]MDD5372769.1 sugar phosphate isomerase/epimerase [Sulfurimonas sp.]
MKNIGIMQGRLLPRYEGRYQAHPLNYWQAEFYIAKELGFAQIEFILDYNDYEQNPLMSKNGIKEIKEIIKQTGVDVKSVCADYFMQAPFHSIHQKESQKILKKLIKNVKKLNVVDIVIPCVDQSTLKDENDFDMLVESIKRVLPLAEKYGININFETDLNPQRFKELLDRFDSKSIKVNYDIGNSASLGYNPKEEFKAYGEYISDLHIKDRVLGGGSVKLGEGSADFKTVFSMLKKYKFNGNIIMQSAKADEYIDDLMMVKEQKEFITKYIEKYL